jgi:hypothetical protein
MNTLIGNSSASASVPVIPGTAPKMTPTTTPSVV